jgi:putative CRISPR-associated protein (TIGR02619 family)
MREALMPKLIITTVGTSLILNEIYDKRTYGSTVTLMQKGTKPSEDKYNQIVNSSAEKLMTAVNANLEGKNLSAEIASLMAFKNGEGLGFDTNDLIVLLATNTIDGMFCADVHKKVLDDLKWCKVEGPMKIDGFNTRSANDFKNAGLNNLKQTIDGILDGNNRDDKYFNITGGYKGIIPFATIHAFDKGMKLIYLYEEEGSELMIIDKNPQTQQLRVEVICLSEGGPH